MKWIEDKILSLRDLIKNYEVEVIGRNITMDSKIKSKYASMLNNNFNTTTYGEFLVYCKKELSDLETHYLVQYGKIVPQHCDKPFISKLLAIQELNLARLNAKRGQNPNCN